MTDVVRTLPTVAPAWTDEDAAREAHAIKHSHPHAGWWRLRGVYLIDVPVETVRLDWTSDAYWMGWDDARAIVPQRLDHGWKWEYLGKTREGADI